MRRYKFSRRELGGSFVHIDVTIWLRQYLAQPESLKSRAQANPHAPSGNGQLDSLTAGYNAQTQCVAWFLKHLLYFISHSSCFVCNYSTIYES